MLRDPSSDAGRRATTDENTSRSLDMRREAAIGGGCGCATGAAHSHGHGTGLGPATRSALEKIESELRAFEVAERQRLGLEPDPAQWSDANPQAFTAEERGGTRLLFGGLTAAHDAILEAGLRSLGYNAQALPYADVAALQTGKEFGNRGQCNPTYFTVGNLVNHLVKLRDKEGVPTDDIVRNNAFLTFGACGPCRFGTYVTEYRKALRDSGFHGFRVMALSQEGPQDDIGGTASAIDTNLEFYIVIVKALMAGDIINLLGYRNRPYEIEAGATDAAMQVSIEAVRAAFIEGRSILRAMKHVRKAFANVKVNRLQPKPKVAIIGEFWAMTTEGDGNYRLQRFLEEEGAECDIQIITVWALYIVWTLSYDIRESTMLRRRKGEVDRFEGLAPRKGIFFAWLGGRAVKLVFGTFAKLAGLRGYKLPNMREIADLAHEYYPNQLRGGEGHMEVGKVIQTAKNMKDHMIISVKPFGCMPSSGVSDGVQSLVSARFPEVEFLPIETTGDSAVNAYSRVQMALFRARAKAHAEFEEALKKKGLTAEEAARKAEAKASLSQALNYPAHTVTGTAANAVYELE
ncbi:MAG: 2-hydroxyglutaryl-CoA dehydratase [Alphaproteobacteria bacterium]|nr:2-hydroxyglutaryl-CoA dehydratase [Alphaproteobacteria bacterium]